MTIHAMEVLLKNLDDRLSRIERILPPLAQKVDTIDAATSGLRALIEDSRSDTRLLAEHVSRLLDRVDGAS